MSQGPRKFCFALGACVAIASPEAPATAYTFTPIDVPFAGVVQTFALGINNGGQIVGDYLDSSGVHGFLDNGGSFSPIDVPFPGAAGTEALGIDSGGQIVGCFNCAHGATTGTQPFCTQQAPSPR